MMNATLLSGPDMRSGREPYAQHIARLGQAPPGRPELIDTIERSELRGRGGAAFPVGVKWRSVAAAARRPVILANGAEGEPLSGKDRMLMEYRPHLILDGADLAAKVLRAREVVLYIGAEHTRAIAVMANALRERPGHRTDRIRIISAPVRYVSGEESAAVHFANDGVALPTTVPPRPYQRGVDGRPTLVQNVETLAHIAMIARYGDEWFRSLGHGTAAGTALFSVTHRRGLSPVVVGAAQGTTVAEVVETTGTEYTQVGAVLLGGFFGGWLTGADAAGLPLDGTGLKARGLSMGCGVLRVLPAHECGVGETARILAYLAGESARQCGPCVFGLSAMAAAVNRIAAGTGSPGDLHNLERWCGQVAGGGACHHPDGAVGMLRSALQVFRDEFRLHAERRSCSRPRAAA